MKSDGHSWFITLNLSIRVIEESQIVNKRRRSVPEGGYYRMEMCLDMWI